MKILFRTSGGRAPKKQLGLGHIYRCINLATMLKPNEIYFLVEEYVGVKKILHDNGYNRISYLRKDSNVDSDIKKTIEQIIEKNIDMLIVDKYDIKPEYLKEVRKFVKVVLISDLRKIDYSVDLLINGFIGFDDKIITNKYGSKCLLGPSYQILSDKFSRKCKSYKKKYALLATFGGFDEKNIVEMLLTSLASYKKKIETKVILGPVTRKSKKISMLEQKYKKYFTITKKTKDMHEEICNARYGICSGGITTYEFAAVNIPFAIVCQVRHQLTTAKEWERRGIALNLGLLNNKISKKIEGIIEKIIANRIPHHISKRPIVDGLGTKRVVHEILKLKN